VKLDFTVSSFTNPGDVNYGLALVIGTKITSRR
jgi:hypothetical protein